MPLLPLEPYLYPDDLLSAPASAEDGSEWWVLHTRPRAEKCLARRFLKSRMPFFLPLHQRRWQNQGRRFSSFMPLFPGYVFLNGDYQARWEALRTNLVVQVLPVKDQARLCADLARVYQLMESDAPLTPEERLRPGSPVEIVAGPLAGVQGQVIRQGNQWRLLIEVQFLQRGVSVEVEHWMIQLLTPRSRLSAGVACG